LVGAGEMAPIGLKGFSLGGAKSKFQKEKEKVRSTPFPGITTNDPRPR